MPLCYAIFCTFIDVLYSVLYEEFQVNSVWFCGTAASNTHELITTKLPIAQNVQFRKRESPVFNKKKPRICFSNAKMNHKTMQIVTCLCICLPDWGWREDRQNERRATDKIPRHSKPSTTRKCTRYRMLNKCHVSICASPAFPQNITSCVTIQEVRHFMN